MKPDVFGQAVQASYKTFSRGRIVGIGVLVIDLTLSLVFRKPVYHWIYAEKR